MTLFTDATYKAAYDLVSPELISWEFYEPYTKKEPPFSSLGLIIYLRTYSRYIDSLERREKWCETILRVVEYSLSLDKITPLADKKIEAEKLFDALFNLDCFAAGRSYWVAGTAQTKKDSSSNWNCVFRNLDTLSAFTELFYWLLIGAGTGFSVEKKNIEKLPILYPSNKKIIHDDYEFVDSKEENTLACFFSKGINDVPYSKDIEAKDLSLSDEDFFYTVTRHASPKSVDKVCIVVGDSKEGWCNALRLYLQLLSLPKPLNILFNYDAVRPKGQRIKTFGGRSSGYQNIKECIELIHQELLLYDGKFTSVLALTLMNIIGRAVVSGGVRRTAEDGLGDKDDITFIEAKYGLWEKEELARYRDIRDKSNNSVMYYEKPSLKELKSVLERARHNGEPGLCAIGNAQKYDPEIDGYNPSLRAGTKVLTANGIHEIQNLEGKENLQVYNLRGELSPASCFLSGKGKPLYKVNLKGGKSYYATAEHKWAICTDEGYQKKTTLELSPGCKLPVIKQDSLYHSSHGNYEDGFWAGWLLGDGWITTRGDNGKTQVGMVIGEGKEEAEIKLTAYMDSLGVNISFSQRNNGTKEFNTQNQILTDLLTSFGIRHKKFGLPACVWNNSSEEFRKGLVDGLFSSDGTIEVSSDTNRVTLNTSKKQLAEDISELLGFYGIKTTILSSTTKANFPNGKDYEGKSYDMYTLRISDRDSIAHFHKLFKLTISKKQQRIDKIVVQERTKKRDNNFIQVISVEAANLREDVWDLTVHDDTHCFQLSYCITGNCFESGLHSKQSCNLVTNNAASCVITTEVEGKTIKLFNYIRWSEILELSTKVACRQTTADQWHPEWDKVQKSQRLLGVSITGIMDVYDALNWTNEDLKEFFAFSKKITRETADAYNKELGIERSARVSLIKPEGTLSKLAGVSEGIHRAYAPQFINRIRFASNDPLAAVLFQMGVPVSPENNQGDDLFGEKCNTWVFSFPVKSPTKLRYIDEPALEQAERYRIVQKNYVDGGHNCSITVSTRDDEWEEVYQWTHDNWDDIIAMSFLGRFDPSEGEAGAYPNMPKETCTPRQYQELADKLPALTEEALLERLTTMEKEYDEFALDSDCGTNGNACPTR